MRDKHTGNSQRESFPIVGSFNVERITKIDAQQTINLYELFDKEGKKRNILVPTPGLSLQEDLSLSFAVSDNFRGSLVFGTDAYFVVDEFVYKMDSALTVTQLGPAFFTTTAGFVGIAANETEIAFTDGVKYLVLDTGTNIITDESVSIAPILFQDLTNMDGYIIGIEKGTNKFHVSNLNDATVYGALNFALVNSSPDIILNATSRLKRRLFLFGKNRTELWLDAGSADFPFRRDNNLLFEHGVIAPGSVSEGFERLFYLSGDEDGVGSVKMVVGTSPQTISTEAVDLAIQAIADPTDAAGFVYKINGHIFYQLNFTSGNRTFVYNVNTQRWHELEMLDGSRHIGQTHFFFTNKHFIGASNSAKLYQFSDDFLTNDGERIKRTRIARNFNSPSYNRVRIDRFQLDMLQGVGDGTDNTFPTLPTLDDADPKVYLSISEDGGLTYQGFGTAQIGKLGERLRRTIWRRLGVRRDSIIRVEMFNNVKIFVLGAAIDYEELPE